MSDHPETTKAKILIVEDEALIGLDLKIRLTNLGYTVVDHVFSAEKALERIEPDPPDLILMDIITQGKMDGIEAAAIIRERWGIPVIFTTAYADRERIKSAKLAYPFGYLLKPYQDRDIEVTIEMALYVAKVNGERRKAEKALRKSETDLATAQRIAHIGSWVWDVTANNALWSNETFRIFGIPNEQLEEHRRNFLDLIHPGDRSKVDQALSDALSGSKEYDIEYRIILPDQTQKIIHALAEVSRNDRGDPVLMQGTVHDITERKRAERALRKTEEQYRLLVDQAVDGIFILDAQGNFTFVNGAICEMLGYSQEELLSRSIFDTYRETEREMGQKRFAMIPSGESIFFERDMVHRDGSTFPISASAVKLADNRVQAIVRDITERKLTEEKLVQQNNFLETLLETVPDPIFYKDQEGKYLGCNRAFEIFFGISRQEIIGQSVYVIGPKEIADEYLKKDGELFDHPGEQHYEWKMKRSTGEIRNIVFHKATIMDEKQRPNGIVGAISDITERKRIEEKLRSSEKRYRLIADNSNDWIYMIKPDRTFEYVSPSCEKSTGYTYREFINQPGLMLDIVHPEDKDLFIAHIENVGQEFQPHNMEFRIYTKSSKLCWIRHSCQPICDEEDQYHGRIGTNHDITERKLAEESLRESEEKYKWLVEKAPVGFYQINLSTGKIEQVNDVMISYTGYSFKEFINLTPFDLLTSESAGVFLERQKKIANEEPVSSSVDYQIRIKNGDLKWAEFSNYFFQKDGESFSNVICRDITERKRAEEALKESEERYRTIFEQSNDGIALVKGDRHLYVNKKMVEMFGYDHPEEIIGQTVSLMAHPDDAERVREYNRRRQAGEAVPDRYEFKGRKKNGEEIYVEVSAAKTIHQGNPVSLAFLRDITERKQAERLTQTSLHEKEILLKEIHHRVKNNLAVIGSILSLQSANAPDKTYQDIFQECVNRVKAMSKIHTQLYQTKDLTHIDFKSYLQELLSELYQSYRVRLNNVALNLQIKDFTPDINTAIPLGLIVNELLSNSLKYAFPEGRQGEIKVSLIKDNSQTVLTVADNGIGLPEDFDLTQPQSLGLQLVTALVRQLHGTMEMKRELGTIITIRFPL